MAQWFRGIFKTRSAPVVTEARAALVPPPPPPPPPAPSLMDLVRHWRAVFRREAEATPSVDQTQQRDAQEMERRARQGTDTIARGIARRGCWFPWDD